MLALVVLLSARCRACRPRMARASLLISTLVCASGFWNPPPSIQKPPIRNLRAAPHSSDCRLDEDGAMRFVSTAVVDASPADAYTLLATPARWPEIFCFCGKVGAVDMARQRTASEPLVTGAMVDEIAGAPPLIPVRLTWVCEVADVESRTLELKAVGSDAGDARRSVSVVADQGGSRVELVSTFSAPSPLFQVLLRLDQLCYARLLRAALSFDSGKPSGAFSAKDSVVWFVLISAWAGSSLGWMSTFGVAIAPM